MLLNLFQAGHLLDRLLQLFVRVADHSAAAGGAPRPVEEGAGLPAVGRQTRCHRQREGDDRVQDQGRGLAVLGLLSGQGKDLNLIATINIF